MSPEIALKLLQTGDDSDFTITCQGWTVRVHRLFLKPQSDYFRAVCGVNFKEGQEGQLDLPDVNPHILARVLCWLYTGDYDVNAAPDGLSLPGEEIWATETQYHTSTDPLDPPDEKYCAPRLKIHAYVYSCADRLGIEALRLYSAKAFEAMPLELLSYPAFPGLLQLVTDITSPEDPLLRKYLYTWCIEEFSGSAWPNEETQRFMESQEPLAVHIGSVMKKKLQESQSDILCHEVSIKSLEKKVADGEEQLKKVEAKRDAETEYMNKVIQQSHPRMLCVHCGASFAMAYERVQVYDRVVYLRRCVKCQKETKVSTG